MCAAMCPQPPCMVIIESLPMTGSLEIPVSVLNHLVFLAYDEWKRKLSSEAINMYFVLLDKITKISPTLDAAFELCQYLDKAVNLLNLQGNEIDWLTVANAWIISQWYIEHYKKIRAKLSWKDHLDNDCKVEAV